MEHKCSFVPRGLSLVVGKSSNTHKDEIEEGRSKPVRKDGAGWEAITQALSLRSAPGLPSSPSKEGNEITSHPVPRVGGWEGGRWERGAQRPQAAASVLVAKESTSALDAQCAFSCFLPTVAQPAPLLSGAP